MFYVSCRSFSVDIATPVSIVNATKIYNFNFERLTYQNSIHDHLIGFMKRVKLCRSEIDRRVYDACSVFNVKNSLNAVLRLPVEFRINLQLVLPLSAALD